MEYQGLCSGTYAGKSVTPAGDRCKNLFPETMSGAGSPEVKKILMPTPGLSAPVVTLPAGPIQCIYADPSSNTLFVIAGPALVSGTLYRVQDSGTILSTYAPTLGPGPYAMSSNGIQIMISCAGDLTGYIYTFASNTLVKITAAGFLGTWHNVVLDNYFISLVPASRKFQISAILDGTQWNALDYATTNASSDNIRGLLVDHGELWLFGDIHTEVWQDTGNAAFPFERIKSISITQGLAATKACVSLDNAVFWLGRSEGGQCRVFRSDGYVPRGISNRSIEYFFNLYGSVNSVADATMYGYQSETGHTFLVINFPQANVDISSSGTVSFSAINGAQWVYDVAEDEWHERSTLVAGTETIPSMTYHGFVNNKHMVGGGKDTTGALYRMREDLYQYNGVAIKRTRVAPHIVNGLKWIIHHYLRLSCQVGQGSIADPFNVVNLRVSNDGGITWSSTYPKNLGAIGDYRREINWRQLGRAKRRAYEFSTTVNAPFCILDADIGVDGEQ